MIALAPQVVLLVVHTELHKDQSVQYYTLCIAARIVIENGCLVQTCNECSRGFVKEKLLEKCQSVNGKLFLF